MPIYEYVCRDCGDKFEKLIRAGADKPNVACPACESHAVERQISVCCTVGGGADSYGPSSSSACAPSGGG